MSRETAAKLLSVLLAAALALALLAPAGAFARAGGGHVGSPGRSGGSSSRGSGGGLSGGVPIPIPIGGGGGGSFGTIVLILVVVGIVLYVRSRNGGSGAGTAAPPVPPQTTSLDALKSTDPDFGEQGFYGRVNEMFIAVQHAWQARDMEPARRFLADQQFDVLQGGVQEYVRNGRLNKLDGLHVDRIEPVSVTAEGGYDYVRVLVTATVIDYTVDERTGELVNPGVLGDGKTPKTFQEYWTLVRKQGAQTKAEATIRKCPNCGAPVTDGNYVKCAYCGTQMNDPSLDWVLLRIEQV